MRFFILLILIFTTTTASAAQKISIGETFTLHSKIIGEDRPLSVFIPKGVEKNESLYVIYLLDSQHHFHTVTGIVQSLVDYDQIPKTMVVGVETTNRPRDYLPAINGEPKTQFQKFKRSKWPDEGQTNFIKFLNDELFPFIDDKYPTYPHRTLIGHSNAGTFALSALFNHPNLFQNYLAISANGWWSYDETVHNAKSMADKNRSNKRLFISVAGEGSTFYTGTLNLLSNMETHKPTNLAWQYKQYPNHTHMSGILPAVTDGLTFLYTNYQFEITPALAKYSTVSALKDYYADLSKQYGFAVPAPVGTYVDFAEAQQNNKRSQEAIITLKQFVADYPKHSYSHMKLAQAYALLDQHEKSLNSYLQGLKVAKEQKLSADIIDAFQDMVDRAQAKLNANAKSL
ncbi:alpha/beta hydrolase [Parashewanella curva]|uniref:Alpha/beta hydrolase n=1 Tax=Parashewanella curva TaxID=2338552 RepID=A0A3L8PWE1_9GAMM|nr:alpha/beta hydrolase-fold protein [Parashewanella curva]RLV59676.1 alpha/beta hydrolase [Parashewanella curva]